MWVIRDVRRQPRSSLTSQLTETPAVAKKRERERYVQAGSLVRINMRHCDNAKQQHDEGAIICIYARSRSQPIKRFGRFRELQGILQPRALCTWILIDVTAPILRESRRQRENERVGGKKRVWCALEGINERERRATVNRASVLRCCCCRPAILMDKSTAGALSPPRRW